MDRLCFTNRALATLKAERQHLNAELRIAAKAGLHDYAATLMREGVELDRLIDEAALALIRLADAAPGPEERRRDDCAMRGCKSQHVSNSRYCRDHLNAGAPCLNPEERRRDDAEREVRELLDWQADKDDPDRGDY